MTQLKRRRGFALVTVLLLMAVGTALTFAAISDALVDTDAAAIGTLQRRVLVGAESAAWGALGAASAAALRTAPVGQVSVLTSNDGEMTLITTVDKTDNSNVWIVATATIQRSAIVARHRVGLSAVIPSDTTDLTLHLVPERAWAELF
ncbi:MAG: hypothetical protein ABI026_07135 [Gemmatimonadaceae bacterium]